MAQSLAQLYVHIVFSTKKRFPFIKPPELYAYMGGTIKRLGGIPFMINGMPDHVHVFSSLPKTVALSKFIEDIKRTSSKWIKTKDIIYQHFAWQNGYAGFSVSSSKKDVVVKYIANQKKHHEKLTFKEEVLQFLNEYEVEYDERYLWD
jgi:REP element-mobilizing transposase RayT